MHERLEALPKSKRMVALALAGVATASCSIDSYHSDPAAVECDGTRTLAHFDEGISQIVFLAHDDNGEIVRISANKDGDQYNFSAQDQTGEQLEGGITAEGSPNANIDFSIKHDDALWTLDVRPDDQDVVISGRC